MSTITQKTPLKTLSEFAVKSKVTLVKKPKWRHPSLQLSISLKISVTTLNPFSDASTASTFVNLLFFYHFHLHPKWNLFFSILQNPSYEIQVIRWFDGIFQHKREITIFHLLLLTFLLSAWFICLQENKEWWSNHKGII